MHAYRGFSLIESIVSIFIVGVMLLLLQGVLRSAALAQASQHQNAALSIARNELESLRAGGYGALPDSGPFYDSLLSSLPSATAYLTISDYEEGEESGETGNEIKQVTVRVQWQDPGITASSTVSLSTLISQTGGLP